MCSSDLQNFRYRARDGGNEDQKRAKTNDKFRRNQPRYNVRLRRKSGVRMGKFEAKFVYKFAQDKLRASKFDADFALSFLRFNALKFDIDTTNRRNLRALRAGVSIEFNKTHADEPSLIRDVKIGRAHV